MKVLAFQDWEVTSSASPEEVCTQDLWGEEIGGEAGPQLLGTLGTLLTPASGWGLSWVKQGKGKEEKGSEEAGGLCSEGGFRSSLC